MSDTPEPTTTRRTTGDREFMLLVTALMATTALGIDLMLPAFPDIRSEFGMPADSTKVAWILTAYFLGMAVGPWCFGPASDRFGRRAPLRAGLVLYGAASIVAALAPSWPLVVASRFLWGIGASGPRSLSIAMVRDRHEGDSMARLMSMIMAVFLLVPIAAPAIGAGLIAVLPWRAVFWFPAVVSVALLVWVRRLPETLSHERRRPFTFRAVALAGKEVVTHRQAMMLTLAMMFLFGIMNTYLAGSEVLLGDVFGYGEWFPLYFGAIAVALAANSLSNSRRVQRLGLNRLIRRTALVGAVSSCALAVVSYTNGGHPNFWVFTAVLTLTVPMAQGLSPLCNTAAMTPLPHVAGTASAIIATVTTAGGALLGTLSNDAFDGTAGPFGLHMAIYLGIAGLFVALGTTGRTADTAH